MKRKFGKYVFFDHQEELYKKIQDVAQRRGGLMVRTFAGSGKTLPFMVAILEKIFYNPDNMPACVICSSTCRTTWITFAKELGLSYICLNAQTDHLSLKKFLEYDIVFSSYDYIRIIYSRACSMVSFLDYKNIPLQTVYPDLVDELGYTTRPILPLPVAHVPFALQSLQMMVAKKIASLYGETWVERLQFQEKKAVYDLSGMEKICKAIPLIINSFISYDHVSATTLLFKKRLPVVILDESGAIRNLVRHKAKFPIAITRLLASVYACLSATPYHNKYGDLFSQLIFLRVVQKQDFEDWKNAEKQKKLAIRLMEQHEFHKTRNEIVMREPELKLKDPVYITMCRPFNTINEQLAHDHHEYGLVQKTSINRLVQMQLACVAPCLMKSKRKQYKSYPDNENGLRSTKMLMIEYIMNMIGDKKILIFSFFKYALYLIQAKLKKMGIKSDILRGGQNEKTKQKIIDNYQGKMQALLASLKSEAEGWNGGNKTRVVVFATPFPVPGYEYQAVMRAVRKGQEHTVFVIHCIIDNSVEVSIRNIAQRKIDEGGQYIGEKMDNTQQDVDLQMARQILTLERSYHATNENEEWAELLEEEEEKEIDLDYSTDLHL